jgi:AcrR family transcriptional regulator
MTSAKATGKRRGPKASLSLDQIAQQALRIADDGGLESLTMKRLASALGVGEMTLYGYVRTKDEIFDALTDLALSELALPARGEWDTQLRELFNNLHDLLVRHPSVAHLDSVRPTTGPAALRIANRTLGLLGDARVDDATAFAAHRALMNYTIGTVLFHVSRGTPAGEAALRERQVAMQIAVRDYPHIARHLDRYQAEATPAALQREFEFGLDHLIDSIRPQRRARPC